MTITLTREEAQQALDALDEYRDSTEDFRVANRCISLIETLRARLSAPEPEPWQVIPDSVGTKHLTEMKAKHVIERDGRVVTGYVLDTNDSVCIVYHSAVRWFSNEEMFRVMHSNVYQPKPVAWMDEEGFTWTGNEFPHEHKGKCKPLYTAPPQRKEWQGLTDEDRNIIAKAADANDWHDYQVMDETEAKLREKNA
jgi:hypothetical protein